MRWSYWTRQWHWHPLGSILTLRLSSFIYLSTYFLKTLSNLWQVPLKVSLYFIFSIFLSIRKIKYTVWKWHKSINESWFLIRQQDIKVMEIFILPGSEWHIETFSNCLRHWNSGDCTICIDQQKKSLNRALTKTHMKDSSRGIFKESTFTWFANYHSLNKAFWASTLCWSLFSAL